MSDSSTLDLREARARLRDLCTRHRSSVEAFAPRSGGAWFKLDLDESEVGQQPDAVRHLSSSASCIESLLTVPPFLDRGLVTEQVSELARGFAIGAIERAPDTWRSERGAYTYCRARTLPVVLDSLGDDLTNNAESIRDHLAFVWRLVSEAPGFQGIFEHDPDPQLDKWFGEDLAQDGEERPRYPPNAFLTYWAIGSLRRARTLGILGPDDWMRQEQVALLWSRQMLAAQVALRSARSQDADPQQLAWAIASVASFGDPEEVQQPASIDLLSAGLAALFEQQNDDGSWPRGQPLFHYPGAGNAYCYTFETLSELLRVALDDDQSLQLRRLLAPFRHDLLNAVSYAESTREEMGGDYVWCSRHASDASDLGANRCHGSL